MYGIRTSNGKPYRVLIIDDSTFITKQLSKILASQGFEVVAITSEGAMGAELYKEEYAEIDLITLDITLPKMDGLAALEKIISFNPQAVVVPVSTLGREDLVEQAIILGAKAFMVKPLDRKKVLERISALLLKPAV